MSSVRRTFIACATLIAASTAAAMPTTFTYAGTLRQGGVPKNGTVQLVIELYSDEEGGTPLFSESQSEIVTEGELLVDIGTTTPLEDTLLDGDQLWMSLVVDGIPLEPRVRVGAVPYAIWAQDAVTLGGKSATEFATETTALQSNLNALSEQLAALQSQISALNFDTLPGVPAALKDGDQVATFTAGPGLAVTGNAIGIAPGGVTANMLAANSVNKDKLPTNKLEVWAYRNDPSSEYFVGQPTTPRQSKSCGANGQRLDCEGNCVVNGPASCNAVRIGYVVPE